MKKTEKVLLSVVDGVSREVISRVLESISSCQVCGCGTAEEALRVWINGDNKFDLLVVVGDFDQEVIGEFKKCYPQAAVLIFDLKGGQVK